MSQEILQSIFTQVINNPKLGIAIKDNLTSSWIVPFTTLIDMNASGYDTVESFLSSVNEKGYNDITVYLKRKNGSTSVYVNDKLVRLTSQTTSGRDSSTNAQGAFSGNSENAPALVTIPTKKAPVMHNNQPMGLLGGMNDLQVVDMYSKSSQYDTQNQELQALRTELQSVKSENEHLKFENFKLDSKLETKNSEKKTLFSDEIGAMLISAVPTFAEKFAKSSVGLNAPAQVPAETFSANKTQLLNFIKNDGITDGYCQLLTAVLNNAIADENVVKQLQELAQTKSE